MPPPEGRRNKNHDRRGNRGCSFDPLGASPWSHDGRQEAPQRRQVTCNLGESRGCIVPERVGKDVYVRENSVGPDRDQGHPSQQESGRTEARHQFPLAAEKTYQSKWKHNGELEQGKAQEETSPIIVAADV